MPLNVSLRNRKNGRAGVNGFLTENEAGAEFVL